MSSVTIAWMPRHLFFQHFLLLKGRQLKCQQINCLHETTQYSGTRNCMVHPGIFQNGPSFYFLWLYVLMVRSIACDSSFTWLEQRDHSFHIEDLFVTWPLLYYHIHHVYCTECCLFSVELLLPILNRARFPPMINITHKTVFISIL